MRTELQINPVPIARITITKPCAECEETETEEARAKGIEEDRVSLSAESQEALEKEGKNSKSGNSSGKPVGADGQPVSEEDARIIQQLQATDREVRAHEQAHKAAAGPYAVGGPTFQYTTGPDGKRYAVGGEVRIDTAPVPDNPEATIVKAQTIRRAALAPADPSGQDRQVAAAATQLETQARQEIQEERRAENQEKTEGAEEEGATAPSAGQENTSGTEAPAGPGSPAETSEAGGIASASGISGTGTGNGADTKGDTFEPISGNAPGATANQNAPDSSEAPRENPVTRRQTRQFTDSPAAESGQLLNLFT